MIALTSNQDRIAQCEPERCHLCDKEHYESDDFDDLERVESVEAAAHCCLWKVVGHPVRVRIAGRVNSGATWLESMQAEGVLA